MQSSSAQRQGLRIRSQPPSEAELNEALEALALGDALVAPPEVETAGAIGPNNNRFAREEHTHSGLNLGDAQVITGAKTFDLDPSAPFIVTSGSAVVTNLDADKVDGKEYFDFYNSFSHKSFPERKSIKELIRSFAKEFKGEQTVRLQLKTEYKYHLYELLEGF